MSRPASWWREPGTGDYARTEREWRWLLPVVPQGVTDVVDLEDRYLRGTTLRLRHMRGAAGDVFKLAQKVRPRADDPSVVAITNIYLTAAEHDALAAVPADALTKRRHRWPVGDHDVAVDELLGRWSGLVLAELEHAASAHVPALPDAIDVTGDDRFSGGALAATPDEEVGAVLDVVRRLVVT